MAGESRNRTVDVKRDVYHGNILHSFSYTFKLPNLDMRAPWTFREEFRTRCESGPSSWSCEMVFHKVEDNGKVSFPVTLKRTDSGSNAVKVLVDPQIYDDFGRNLTDSWVVKGEGIRGGDVLEKTLEGDFSNTAEGFCFILQLRVQIFIFVMYCHSTSTV
ncbi:hypothetical protein AVEN_171318-1 [Araneus ventricosus]|uniref:MATH domain-containing protein n=1 Tax=Araneus ventricosus TaxID=182803 RepID=A0A4Y2M598_ARAVE|nr:hypothetical protein AVEN_171318-1 [Araneus ventricosus]